jgi:cyclopropane fatty-acyl-phospholipid synthase-like methyltransferase
MMPETIPGALDFPATQKNRQVIGDVLSEIFDPESHLRLLEVASGSGQHAVYFASRFPNWTIQPTDIAQEHLNSISAYTEHQGLSNVLPPQKVDVSADEWNLEGSFDGLWAINLIHISPWECTLGLLQNTRNILNPGGLLYLYGAYRRNGEHTSDSNRAFDQSLRASNPTWGVRCLDELTETAQQHGFRLQQVIQMPANNLSVVFQAV